MQQAIALDGQQHKLLAVHIVWSVELVSMGELEGQNDGLTRRRLLVLLSAGAVVCVSGPAFAGDDGGGEGGDSDGDSSGSGNSGSGGGEGGDDGGDDGGGEGGDDDGDDDSSGSSGGKGKTQDDARDALRKGEVIPLSLAITKLHDSYDGRIIDVRLTEKGTRLDYRFKVVAKDGKVVSVTMNARNGRLRGFLGF
jgi:hypothetical protein